MSDTRHPAKGNRAKLWVALAAFAGVIAVLLIGKFGGFFDPEQLGAVLGQSIQSFAGGPFGVPALIIAFCVCAFIAVPQFVLIGVSVFAFGAAWGAVWAWIATLFSGALTFWIGRYSGEGALRRLAGGRVKRFTDFVARNAFAASAIVRNVPTGPFLVVNMVFGAIRANFIHYISGMAVGVIPKIALVAFGLQAIEAALQGNTMLAVGTAIAAVAVFLGGFFYVRQRRRKGENIALSAD